MLSEICVGAFIMSLRRISFVVNDSNTGRVPGHVSVRAGYMNTAFLSWTTSHPLPSLPVIVWPDRIEKSPTKIVGFRNVASE